MPGSSSLSTANIARALTYIERIKLKAIERELNGGEETEETKQAFDTFWGSIHRVENLIKGILEDSDTQNQTEAFSESTISSEDLTKVGVERKLFVLVNAKISDLTKGLTTDAEAEIAELNSRIEGVYECVNMDCDPCMILDAILLSLRKISLTQQRDVAIIPTVVTTAQALISHPISGYQLRLSRTVDYVIIDYNEKKNTRAFLVGPGGSRDACYYIKNNPSRLFLLVEAKCRCKDPADERDFNDYIPKAIGQAIVLLKSAELPEVRFCLSNGRQWKFFILKLEDDTLTSYESVLRRLGKDDSERGHIPLGELVVLLREWMRPTVTDLYELR